MAAPRGMIFFVNNATQRECFEKCIGGLPPGKKASVSAIKTGDLIFVYNTASRLFHGIFVASCDGGFRLEPDAFGGGFPAQVKFQVALKCPDQPLAAMKAVLKLDQKGHFAHELDAETALRIRHVFERAAGAPLTTYGSAAPARAPVTSAGASAPSRAPVHAAAAAGKPASGAAAAQTRSAPSTPVSSSAPAAHGSGPGVTQLPARPAMAAPTARAAPAAAAAQPPSAVASAPVAKPAAAAPGPAPAPSATHVPVDVVLPWLSDDYISQSEPAPAAASVNHSPAGSPAENGTSASHALTFKECVICLELQSLGDMVALVPCGHRCICAMCSATKILPGVPCPKCRQQVMFGIKVFD
jgi:Development and cell death domain/Zinc finger, C3HC4 type (RING finger)